MRYATAYPAPPCQARSLRIGRCARCHAPVLASDEHYGSGSGLVHGACATAPPGADQPAGAVAGRRPRPSARGRTRGNTTAAPSPGKR